MKTCDHWPYVTKIPRASVLRFKNHWLSHEDFINVAVNGWVAPDNISISAKILISQFENLRIELRAWKKQFPKLAITIENIKLVLHFLETVELFRSLSLQEWNFRNLVVAKLIDLLRQQIIY